MVFGSLEVEPSPNDQLKRGFSAQLEAVAVAVKRTSRRTRALGGTVAVHANVQVEGALTVMFPERVHDTPPIDAVNVQWKVPLEE